MKIICLHGGGANSNILKTLLAPLTYELAKSDTVEFFFIEGPVECPAAIGIAEQYEGPYYRYLTGDAPHMYQVANSARAISKTATSPESFAREMGIRGLAGANSTEACDFIEQTVEEHDDGPFDGILGFSEGSSVAASLMLRRAAQGRVPLFRFAIFFCAVLTFRSDNEGPILADERPERIRVPTLHITGARDPARLSSMTLYNLCDKQLVFHYDHGKGHTIPWGPFTEEITKWIRKILMQTQMSL